MAELHNEKREAITDFRKECEIMKDKLDENKCSYGGTYSVSNPLFMQAQSKFTTDIRYMLGCLRFRYIRKDIILKTNYAEDFEMILKHYVRDGKVVKNNHLAPKTKIYAQGGNDKSGRTIESEKKDKEILNEMYPQYTKLFMRKNGRWDLRLKEYKQPNKSIQHKFVINMKQSTARWEKYKNDTSFIRWPATCRDDITEEIDKRMVSMWNLPKKEHLNKCGCFMSHYRLYEHIVKHKLNDVLILEDDAIIVGELPTIYPKDCITYLGGYAHSCKADDSQGNCITNFKNGINYYDKFVILMTMSYILPTWQVAEELLDYLNTMKRWRAIDWLLCRWNKKHAALYPAVVIEEETSSTIKDKKVKTNIHYQLIKWGEDAMIKQPRLNSFKNIDTTYNNMVKIDDSVKINGGKSNKCEGVVTSLKNVFVMVRITKDKKGKPVFGDNPIKVKKSYLEVIAPPAIEMPTEEDLVVVDTSTNQEKDIFINKSILINENNVVMPAPTIDDAWNWKRDNEKLTLQLKSMVSFQSKACGEIAELQMVIKSLKEELGDSIRLDKIEQIKQLINSI